MRAAAILLLFAVPAFAQEPKNFPPDEKTLAEIKVKTGELEKAIAAIPKDAKELPSVQVFHKAAVWIVRHNEWFTEKSGQNTLDVLKAGLARAKALKDGRTPWLDLRDKPIALGYKSFVDDSIQPFSLRYPENFDPKKKYRFDVVLHGRDGTLTEVKFLHGKETAKAGKGTDYFVMEVYGRGNNAYRWSGETDVFEALGAAKAIIKGAFDERQVVIRGFSMGGAGTWHLGLHHPGLFAVMQPGAGFSVTHGYAKGFPAEPPDYIAKGLHIYDAVDYAENCFNIPVVAYSGSKDPQKAAADNIEKALKGFKEPHSFTHIVAPDLEHKQPPEWWAKCDAEIRKHLEAKLKAPRPERVRFTTYTMKYPRTEWVGIFEMEEHYKRAVIDANDKEDVCTIKTENVKSFMLTPDQKKAATRKTWRLLIDDAEFEVLLKESLVFFEKVRGKWVQVEPEINPGGKPHKHPGLQGPIDDAFSGKFQIVPATKEPWNKELAKFTSSTHDQFAKSWDKYFRAEFASALETSKEARYRVNSRVLFGDPQSNPEIAQMLPDLPIQWTKDELVVNGIKYDAKTHVPMLIYPVLAKQPPPFDDHHNFIVLNSGHTFHEDALKGSNVLLYPRLGDWAVVKPKPTKEDPAAYEVVASGYFDEFWQFPKKK